MSAGPVPPSPGVGARRKGPKTLPRLPLSAFSPPNSGTSDAFPLPPSPSTMHPERIVDAQVIAPGGDLARWTQEAGAHLGGKTGGVVVSLHGQDTAAVERVVKEFTESKVVSGVPVIALSVPFRSTDLAAPGVNYGITYTQNTPDAVDELRAAFETGKIVDIDVQTTLSENSEAAWEALEDYLTKAADQLTTGPVVISNILPPPDSLAQPIVKLLSHPSYRSYQSHIAVLSLFPSLYVKFLPPAWHAPTPSTPTSATLDPDGNATDGKEKKEWKRRIKMYIGPALEAFGYERIIFGSSPSPSSSARSSAGDWYELARESFAELGIEQDAIDAIFGGNAVAAYGAPAA